MRSRTALDAMLDGVAAHRTKRDARLLIDRVFTIDGAGTVVTGTLTGDCLGVGDEVELYPAGAPSADPVAADAQAAEERACPVVTRRGEPRRGRTRRAGTWRRAGVARRVAPDPRVRGAPPPGRAAWRAVTGRGAFKLYVGAAEADARCGSTGRRSSSPAPRRSSGSRATPPLVLDVCDRFVVREAGRRETVAGGTVLDLAPPRRAGRRRSPARRARRGVARRAPRAPRRRAGGGACCGGLVLTGSGAGVPQAGTGSCETTSSRASVRRSWGQRGRVPRAHPSRGGGARRIGPARARRLLRPEVGPLPGPGRSTRSSIVSSTTDCWCGLPPR